MHQRIFIFIMDLDWTNQFSSLQASPFKQLLVMLTHTLRPMLYLCILLEVNKAFGGYIFALVKKFLDLKRNFCNIG